MNLSDFIIVYLACGAPLGVYYFLNNRSKLSTKNLCVRTILTFICWIPYLFKLLKRNNFFANLFTGKFFVISSSEENIQNEIFVVQKNIEDSYRESKLGISIYEFREIFERYVGLTLAKNTQSQETLADDNVFDLSNHSNIDLAKICYKRRNRKHLSFHQINARRDFLNIINELSVSISDRKKLSEEAFEFVKLLNDEEAQYVLAEIFDKTQQTQQHSTVNKAEEEQWKTDTHKPLHANQLPIRLQAMHATAMNLHKKD